ncbi:hypothetical protein PHET_10049 [Paragonimus heterotremus]|uniref:Uncharacterized protein n=1 Tax=Paragonimus heterotremus TaxID=100268 RepID=A0A8J4SZ25_9TREM|nr:hypothetical protein PHET_10049 [Paragonimus heterotremus]
MSCAVDLSEQFEEFFGSTGAPKLFDTLEQLEETLDQFQQLFGAVYRIRSTEYNVGRSALCKTRTLKEETFKIRGERYSSPASKWYFIQPVASICHNALR